MRILLQIGALSLAAASLFHGLSAPAAAVSSPESSVPCGEAAFNPFFVNIGPYYTTVVGRGPVARARALNLALAVAAHEAALQAAAQGATPPRCEGPESCVPPSTTGCDPVLLLGLDSSEWTATYLTFYDLTMGQWMTQCKLTVAPNALVDWGCDLCPV